MIIVKIYVGYEQERALVAVGQNLKEFLNNIYEQFDNLPPEYQLHYKNIRGNSQQVSCKVTFNQFINNYWNSVEIGQEISTLYIIKHQGREYDQNDETQDSLDQIFKCRICHLRVVQHFRCFQCMDFMLCDICVQNQTQHYKHHQFIFIQRPEYWNNLKKLVEVKLRTLQLQSEDTYQNNQYKCFACEEIQNKYGYQQNILKYDQLRYSCLECNNEVCQDCFLEGMHQLHHILRIDYSK